MTMTMARHLAALSAVVAILPAGACTGGGVRDLGPERSWIASTGFPDRDDWPSVSLHVSRTQMTSVRRLSDLVRADSTPVPRPPVGETWGVHRRLDGNAAGCALGVMLNGVQMIRVREDRLLSLDGLARPQELDGIEVHHGGEGPVHDSTGCGTVLLWTERISRAGDEPFVGRIVGAVAGEHADAVEEVRLEPVGPLARRFARVYAYDDTDLEWFYPTRGLRSAASQASSMDS
jgi:hypothetical protein